MDLKLKDKKAFVSGSTKGIGKAIATALAKEGAKVIINGRKQADVDKVVSLMKGETGFPNISGIACDFSKREEIQNLIDQLGRVDILVNNVGIFEAKPFAEIPDEDWQHLFNINVMSGVRLSRAFLPKMKSNGWGRIIFISSESGMNIPVEMVHYGMTKTAQLAISRGMAETTKGSGVTVNSVLPGPTLSEGVKEFAGVEDENRERVEKEFFKKERPTSLLQRFAEPEEVANMVAFVASPLAAATNGAALKVEGGIVKTAF